jgi:hypothetical protein
VIGKPDASHNVSGFTEAGIQTEGSHMKKLSKQKLILLGVAAALILLGAPIKGMANTVTVQLTGVNGKSDDGVYVDPYYGTIDGNPAILVCDDFDHETYMDQTWTANVSTLTNLTDAEFQQATPGQTLKDYEEAAFLFDALLSNPSSNYDGISFALWALFTPSVQYSSGYKNGNAAYWLNDAESQTFSPGEFSNFEILTPVNDGPCSPQEMLTMTPTPEPAEIILFLSGLMALGLTFRKQIFA